MTAESGEPFDCQDELLALFEALTSVLFCLKDADGRYVHVNDAFLARSGRRSKRDLIGLRARDVFVEQRAIDHVHQHLAAPIRAADLAEIAGCSPSRLTRRLRAVVGLTPAQYVVRARVDRATDLLSTTSQSISAVAAACGFHDQAHLTRQFARYTGLTPAQFRSTRSTDLR